MRHISICIYIYIHIHIHIHMMYKCRLLYKLYMCIKGVLQPYQWSIDELRNGIHAGIHADDYHIILHEYGISLS